MAINNFIPTVWSEHLYQDLSKKYIGAAHCSRDFEGEIKEKGNKVKICGLENITVRDYNRNTNMQNPQVLSDNCRELIIDQAKYFNFQVDDVDKVQALPHMMDLALKNAADNLADQADSYIYSLYEEVGSSLETTDEDPVALLNSFINARTILYRYNVVDNNDLVLEVTPDVAAVLLKAKVELQTDNKDLLEAGCIGRLFGVKVYVTNNIYKDTNIPSGSGTLTSYHKCLMRTRRAFAFAEQLSEIEAYRPELRFADAVKGLHLYGAKVVYPNEAVLIDVAMYHEA